MKQIVCISSTNWHPQPTRKQQVMGRLKDCEIIYFDPPISKIAPMKDETLKPRLEAWKGEGEKINDHITVYALPPVWPFYNKYRYINRQNQKKLAGYINKIIKKHGFDKPIIWTYLPNSCDLIKHIPNSGVIYDCIDRHSAYKGLINPKVVDRMEEDLAGKANAAFCTTKGLEERISKFNKKVKLVPNGAAYELFSRAAHLSEIPFPPPDDMFNIKGPVLGFFGALQECIDYSLIAHAAKCNPAWSFVLIGKTLPGVDLSELSGLQNVHLLGFKPYKELPQYLAYMDVCLNLFKSGDLAKEVSPLKFYEYLATGKPIVSTPQPDQVNDYAEIIYIADGKEQFEEKCRQAIGEKSAWHVSRRMEAGKAASWDVRVMEMERYLKENRIF